MVRDSGRWRRRFSVYCIIFFKKLARPSPFRGVTLTGVLGLIGPSEGSPRPVTPEEGAANSPGFPPSLATAPGFSVATEGGFEGPGEGAV